MTVAMIDTMQLSDLIQSLREHPHDPEMDYTAPAVTFSRLAARHSPTGRAEDFDLGGPAIEAFEPWNLHESAGYPAPGLEAMAAELEAALGLAPCEIEAAHQQLIHEETSARSLELARAFAASPLSEARAEIPHPVSDLTPRHAELLMERVNTERARYEASAAEIRAQDLPGMWEEADYLGGAPDEIRGPGEPGTALTQRDRPATRAEIEALAADGWVSDVEAALAYPLMVHELLDHTGEVLAVLDEGAVTEQEMTPLDLAEADAPIEDIERARWKRHPEIDPAAEAALERFTDKHQAYIVEAHRPGRWARVRAWLKAHFAVSFGMLDDEPEL